MTMSASSSSIIIITRKRLSAEIAFALVVLLTSVVIVSQIDGRPVVMIASTVVQQASATASSSSSSSSYTSSSYYRHNYPYSYSTDTTGNDSPLHFTNDPSGRSSAYIATATINQKPAAIAMAFPQTAEEGSLVTLDGTKSRSGPGISYYSWTQVAGPYAGPLSPSATSTFRIPHLDYDTPLQFQLTVQDNLGTTSNTYVTVEARNDDHPPIAYSQSIQTAQNTPVGIQFKATDPDVGDTIRYAIVSQPSHGALSSISYGFLSTTYTPNNGFSGTDSFSIQAFDRNRLVSNIATIYVTVSKVNHPPIAYSQSIQTAQNTPVGIHLSAVDSDSGDVITSFAIVSMPGRGTVTNFDQSSGTLTYTPHAGLGTAATDSFTFNVIDNHGAISKIGVVSITINLEQR